jgi:hypothetical protein
MKSKVKKGVLLKEILKIKTTVHSVANHACSGSRYFLVNGKKYSQ